MTNNTQHNPTAQVFCFFPIEFPTQQGDVFAFTIKEVAADIIFQTGVEHSCEPNMWLKHLRLMVAHPSFKKTVKTPFTLVLHKHQTLLPDIKQIITPLGGGVVFDDAFLAKHMEPVIRFMYEQLKKGTV